MGPFGWGFESISSGVASSEVCLNDLGFLLPGKGRGRRRLVCGWEGFFESLELVENSCDEMGVASTSDDFHDLRAGDGLALGFGCVNLFQNRSRAKKGLVADGVDSFKVALWGQAHPVGGLFCKAGVVPLRIELDLLD